MKNNNNKELAKRMKKFQLQIYLDVLGLDTKCKIQGLLIVLQSRSGRYQIIDRMRIEKKGTMTTFTLPTPAAIQMRAI